MIAFACVFLLKVAAQHSGQYIDDAVVLELTSKAVQQFRSTAVGKWHLVHLMADGLEKMAMRKIQSPTAFQHPTIPNGAVQAGMHYVNNSTSTLPPINGNSIYGNGMMETSFEDDLNMSGVPFLHFDSGNIDFNFSGFGL